MSESGAGRVTPAVPRIAAVALPSALTAAAFVLMSRLGLMGGAPLWLILILLSTAALISESTSRLLAARHDPWAVHVGVGLQCAGVAAIIYAIGWGPTLAIGFLFVAASTLDLAGSRTWSVVVLWTAVTMAAGQVAIALGVVSSYVHPPYVDGLAALEILGVGFVTWVMGNKTRQNELALAERDDAAKDFQSTLSLLTATLDSTADGILVVDNEGKISQFNARFVEMWKLPKELLSEGDDQHALEFVENQLLHPEVFRSKVRELYAHPDAESDDILTFADGRVFERHSLPQRIEGSVVGRVWSFRDITDHHRLLEELEHQAFHDSLTGLANRSLLRNRLENALVRSSRTGVPVGVLLCDMDSFKMVNDTLGHDVGDQLLVEVGSRISGCLREGDTVARLGGDEFAIILDGSSAKDVSATANRVLQALRRPFGLNGREIDIRASIGVTDSTGVSLDADALLCEADIAMYAAKSGGTDRIARFEPHMRASLAAQHALHGDLRQAVRANRELGIDYQPVFDLRTGRPVSTEALVRWNHPQRGPVSPEEFIPVAEEMGLVNEIGRKVLRQACQQASRWRTIDGAGDLSVAVNVSAYQLYDNLFVAEVKAALLDSGLPPGGLVLELTESALLSDTARVYHRLTRLRELGVRIAIDDFGTGYSSLSYLRRLPIDILKIDRSFVSELGAPANQQARSLVKSIVRLGHDLGLTVVAEGVETEHELSVTRAAHCDLVQGYFLAHPSPPEQIEALLESHGEDDATPAPSHRSGVPLAI